MNTETRVVRVGEIAVANGGRESVLCARGVGSCVVVLLHDDAAGVAGAAHPLLPAPSNGKGERRPGRYAETAVALLVQRMREAGADASRIKARLVGGASMFPSLDPPDRPGVGERNLEAARNALRSAGIAIVGEDVGGSQGRSVELHLADGRVRVRAVYRDDVEL